MPQVNRNGFNGAGAGQFFRWIDDPAEDVDFVAYVSQGVAVSDASIDRTGAEPILNWTQGFRLPSSDGLGIPAPTFSEPIGPAGAVWSYAQPNPAYTPTNHALTSTIVTKIGDLPPGGWDCDEFGRPFDLNDLLAPPAS